jgi:hypothetical protein
MAPSVYQLVGRVRAEGGAAGVSIYSMCDTKGPGVPCVHHSLGIYIPFSFQLANSVELARSHIYVSF